MLDSAPGPSPIDRETHAAGKKVVPTSDTADFLPAGFRGALTGASAFAEGATVSVDGAGGCVASILSWLLIDRGLPSNDSQHGFDFF